MESRHFSMENDHVTSFFYGKKTTFFHRKTWVHWDQPRLRYDAAMPRLCGTLYLGASFFWVSDSKNTRDWISTTRNHHHSSSSATATSATSATLVTSATSADDAASSASSSLSTTSIYININITIATLSPFSWSFSSFRPLFRAGPSISVAYVAYEALGHGGHGQNLGRMAQWRAKAKKIIKPGDGKAQCLGP